ncbi:DNA gyrase subunit A [Patescibacteria group bacterium]|nr:DNA gyrase subunit A [Patescibacteria group bacterium]MBU1702785.1 DNA gyrase subunit A [Patescibacteria group bacterium]MBU1954244.1 DNA gyrase subunit A [Patescibacteria group bacterium]
MTDEKIPQELPEEESSDSSQSDPEQEPELQIFSDSKPHPISKEMQDSYIDYAMSVIVSRALPDVRDGLKPVQRRILYAMNEMGLNPGGSFRKSAAVVGEVLGKYHPHGDSPVYQAMVRMAQDFALRYPLVKGQGNFGSIDGDNAAAMRYTEAKMDKITSELMADIEKETIPWIENYDGRYKEPKVLPSKIPQLLLNGSTGIAVGMATSIPPHNAGEVVDALLHLNENPEATVEDLMQFVKGPDFPTGGTIYDQEAIKTAYSTGRGGVIMRAKAEIEERKGGRFAIIITEIPYMVNKATLVTKIADLVRDKKINGISDVRDESNREGMRVVIELKKDSYPKKILNQLYKLTPMQLSFSFNMIALVDGLQPKLLDLKQILAYFIEHRKVVIVNRTKFDLRVAKERAHILEGLKTALDHIDEIISTIRKSATKEEAHGALMKKFKLTDVQAKAILEMKLQTLAGLERKKIEDELNEKLNLIKELESILKDEKKIIEIINKELKEIREKYGDERKTQVRPEPLGKISNKDTIPNEPAIVMLSKENYIKRMPPSSFKAQHRGGKGIIGATTKEEDEIAMMRQAMTHDTILFFTNMGRVFRLPVYEIPVSSRTAKGMAVINLLQLQDGENVTAMLSSDEEKQAEFLLMATQKGTIKKTAMKEFENIRKSGLIAIKLRDGDQLRWSRLINKGNQVMIITRNGKSIRFDEKDISSTGRASMGVRGIKLKDGDEVVDVGTIKDQNDAELLVIMENGLGKCSKVTSYRMQSRGGSGVKAANVTTKTGKIVGAKIINGESLGDIIIISRLGQVIRMNLNDIPSIGRTTQGVYLMRFKGNDKVASSSFISLPPEIDIEEKEDKQESAGQEKLIKA